MPRIYMPSSEKAPGLIRNKKGDYPVLDLWGWLFHKSAPTGRRYRELRGFVFLAMLVVGIVPGFAKGESGNLPHVTDQLERQPPMFIEQMDKLSPTPLSHDKRDRDIGNLLFMGGLGSLVLSVFYATLKGIR